MIEVRRKLRQELAGVERYNSSFWVMFSTQVCGTVADLAV